MSSFVSRGYPISRRTLLQAPALIRLVSAAQAPVPQNRIVRYLESLARSDGGYGYEDIPDSHPISTWAVVGTYNALQAGVPRRAKTAEYLKKRAVRQTRGPENRVTFYRRMQALSWLGETLEPLREEVPRTSRRRALSVEQEATGALAHKLMNPRDAELSEEILQFLESRRRANGSFNNTPASDKADGHVYYTWAALAVFQAYGRSDAHAVETAAWIRDCQLPNGGFTYAPRAAFGAVDDIEYTWAAIQGLILCNQSPVDSQSALKYILSLWNEDGGFGDRPGMASRPEATYWAVSGLRALGALDSLASAVPRQRHSGGRLPAGLKVFSLQMSAPGGGSPLETVNIAKELRIQLWGARGSDMRWTTRVQSVAAEKNVGLTLFREDDGRDEQVLIPGFGSYYPTGAVYSPAGTALAKGTSRETLWQEYRDKRLGAIRKNGGAVLWPTEHEQVLRLLLDDSLERNGYTAAGSFTPSTLNFAMDEPALLRYRNSLNFVALQDARNKEPWWCLDNLLGMRTLFLAQEPTWEGWLDALRRRWVVSVRHDAATNYVTRYLGGDGVAHTFVREHEADWRWWKDDPKDLKRPLAVLTVLHPEDTYEEQHPGEGVGARLRLWWSVTPGGRLRKQNAELAGFSIDGVEISPKIHEIKDAQGALIDQYYYVSLLDPAPGPHQFTAKVRSLADKHVEHYTAPFRVKARAAR